MAKKVFLIQHKGKRRKMKKEVVSFISNNEFSTHFFLVGKLILNTQFLIG